MTTAAIYKNDAATIMTTIYKNDATTTNITMTTAAIYKNDAATTMTTMTTVTTTAIYKNDATTLLKSNNSGSSPSLAVTIQPRRVIRCFLLVV